MLCVKPVGGCWSIAVIGVTIEWLNRSQDGLLLARSCFLSNSNSSWLIAWLLTTLCKDPKFSLRLVQGFGDVDCHDSVPS